MSEVETTKSEIKQAAPPKPWETDRKPNTIFVGRKQIYRDGKLVSIPVPDDEVPTEVKAGPGDLIELPPTAIQRRPEGFYHPRSGFLRRAYGSLYKKPVKLDGTDRDAVTVVAEPKVEKEEGTDAE